MLSTLLKELGKNISQQKTYTKEESKAHTRIALFFGIPATLQKVARATLCLLEPCYFEIHGGGYGICHGNQFIQLLFLET